ncbi:MAG: PadR family transcriptional regulator [Oscillospiraceae bacterium]|nr:PadR family transcriptional regulator [Oscillospiraceae bacterium]
MEPCAPRFAQQLKKGILEMLVLQLIARRPSHGYELLLRLREGSSGLLTLKEGTLYPILYRLEDEGCIVSAWQNQAAEGRPMPRKVYTITPKGLDTLNAEQQVWQAFRACVDTFTGRDEA